VAAVVVGVVVDASARTAAATTTETAATVAACKPKRKPRVGVGPKFFGAFSKMPDTTEDDGRVVFHPCDIDISRRLDVTRNVDVYGAR
jgi:hypothetical protein